MLVIRGVSDEVFSVIDTGRVRVGGDVMAIAGMSHANELAAICAKVLQYESGASFGARTKRSNHELLETLERHPGVIESAGSAASMKSAVVGPSTLGFLHYVLGVVSTDERDMVVNGLAHGSFPQPGNPILVWRERCIFEKNGGGSTVKRTPHVMMTALLFKSINLAIRGVMIDNGRKLMFNPKRGEKWPVIECITPDELRAMGDANLAKRRRGQ
jgi:hypothetical protein